MDVIRQVTRGGLALGGERFTLKIALLAGRRTQRGKLEGNLNRPLIRRLNSMSGYQTDAPVGTMRDCFQLTAEDVTQFEAAIAGFTLSIPQVLH